MLGRAFAGTVAGTLLFFLAGCSSGRSSAPAASDPCARLDLSVAGEPTVKAYGEAASALRTSLGAIENRVFHACDAMNAMLALARPRNTYDACGTFRARVNEARAGGAQIALRINESCSADTAEGGSCADSCQLERCSTEECAERGPCQSACDAVATAGVTCSVATTPELENLDNELAAAITANAGEWGTLESLVSHIETTVTELGPPLLDYAQTADVIGKDEQDCYENALGNLGVALISLDASRDGLAALPAAATEPTN